MSDAASFLAKGAVATAEAIAAGRTSARAVVDASLDRIAKTNDRLHAFIAVTAEEARAEADLLDALVKRGVRRGPFHGVPVAVKDIIDVAGQKTRAGSLTRDHLPAAPADAFVVSRLRAAGAVVVGKSHTVEYAFGGWGTNPIAGTPVNPHDAATPRNPGGSSSGTGVAVGAGLVPIGFGTDTGGSVRLPASWCGTVGHKTSMGLISRAGVVPLALGFDTIGPLARTVRDAAVMSQAMLGSDPADASTWNAPGLDLVSGLAGGVKGLTVGVLTLDSDIAIDREVASAFDRTVKALEAAGARLVAVTLPEALGRYTAACGDLMMVEGAHNHGHLVTETPCRLGEWAARRIGGGFKITATDYFAAVESRRARIRAANAFLHDRGIDVLVLPTTPAPAVPLAQVDETAAPGILTRFANYLEWCGISVPVAKTAGGLPIGFQIVAAQFDDALALRVAQAVETASGGPLPLPM
ncbi:MAG: amidase [Phreatobacter sp.]|uniref:amidase n=1 Tax=Phreatobacter sp. TaxID=1966341 RepID=UPI001A42E91F|nr:amidase [Phreatobacter sp.]MBL8571922.1 amidase [Phreatobacter sp.]